MEIAHRDDVSPELRAWWDALCRETAEAMQGYCLPYVTPISHAISNDDGALEGTGGYLEFADKRWLISNEHVLGDWQTRQFAHQFHGCHDVFRLVGAPMGIEKHPVDAAIWHIPDDVQAFTHRGDHQQEHRYAQRHRLDIRPQSLRRPPQRDAVSDQQKHQGDRRDDRAHRLVRDGIDGEDAQQHEPEVGAAGSSLRSDPPVPDQHVDRQRDRGEANRLEICP